MKSVGFFCPSISNIFCPSAAGPRPPSSGPQQRAQPRGPLADKAVLDVAQAIYHGGKADGVPGLEAVAHIIQNRMHSPSVPERDALGVIVACREQFPRTPPMNLTMQTPAERQLFELATRMATQLVYPPYHLSFPDPTGGMLCRNIHVAGGRGEGHPRAERRHADLGSGAVERFPGPAAAAREHSSESDDGYLSTPPLSPRPVLPTRSRRPLAFLRERGVAGIGMVRRRDGSRSATNGASSPPAGGAAVDRRGPPPRSNWSSAEARAASLPSGSHHHYGHGPSTPTAAASSSSSSAAPSSSQGPPMSSSGVAAPGGDRVPVGALTPPMPPPISAPQAAPSFTPGSSPGASSRLLVRPSHSVRATRSSASPRPARLLPMDRDGYHDMILPCGLFQEEVIEIMYRDLCPEDFEKLCKLDERIPKRDTAQRNLVDRLPRMMAKECNATECRVCLAELEPNAMVVKLPCQHAFHPNCISKWLTQCKNTCPLCSNPISETGCGAKSSVANVRTL